MGRRHDVHAAPWLGLALFAGCACSSPVTPIDAGTLDASTPDAPPVDASAIDARPDARDAAPPRDAPIDVRISIDAGRDAATAIDAGRDAPPVDAPSIDAPPTDAPRDGGPDAPSASTFLQCAPAIPMGATSGISFSSNFWSGFRFPITTSGGARIVRIGLELDPDSAGTAFGAIVRLTGMSDMPDDPTLVGADVLAVVSITVPASPGFVIVEAPTDVMVPPGWYAVVFGTGAFGATVTGGTIPSAGGGGCRALGTSDYPFTIRQSDGMFVLQGAEPHMFVNTTP